MLQKGTLSHNFLANHTGETFKELNQSKRRVNRAVEFERHASVFSHKLAQDLEPRDSTEREERSRIQRDDPSFSERCSI